MEFSSLPLSCKLAQAMFELSGLVEFERTHGLKSRVLDILLGSASVAGVKSVQNDHTITRRR